jgi:hypothetical protein
MSDCITANTTAKRGRKVIAPIFGIPPRSNLLSGSLQL